MHFSHFLTVLNGLEVRSFRFIVWAVLIILCSFAKCPSNYFGSKPAKTHGTESPLATILTRPWFFSKTTPYQRRPHCDPGISDKVAQKPPGIAQKPSAASQIGKPAHCKSPKTSMKSANNIINVRTTKKLRSYPMFRRPSSSTNPTNWSFSHFPPLHLIASFYLFSYSFIIVVFLLSSSTQ